jgi:type IV pilus assembly protein PilY1
MTPLPMTLQGHRPGPSGSLLASRLSWALLSAPMALSAAPQVPAQVPLVSAISQPPNPNVLLTLDDSGSMLSDAMPEGIFQLNGKSVGLITGYWLGAFPDDPRKKSTYQYGTVTASKSSEPVYQMQFRSPDVNSIWYSTDVLYQPWMGSDGKTRMPAYPALAAPWDPVLATAKVDLVTTRAGVSTNWCTEAATCGTATRSFYPGLYYRLKAGADPTLTSSYQRYDINVDGQHAPAVKSPARTDCQATQCTQAEERQNFANWFTYYRMRESLTKAAVSETFANYLGRVRLGWAEINPDNAKVRSGHVVQQFVRDLDNAHLASVLGNVQQISSWPSTPLRTAMNDVGAYFSRTDAENPWLTVPGNAGSGALACRRSVNVMMTDGYYNDSKFGGTGDADGAPGPDHANSNPGHYSPTQYLPAPPFSDGAKAYGDTLADVAISYFKSDLQPAIENKIVPVDGDMAFWQHLTQFTVGLGVKGTLDSSTPEKKLETLNALRDGTLSWPNPAAGQAQKIDDLWHAAVNTGGDFYSVRDVTQLSAALADAFGRAAGNEAKEAGVATAASSLSTGNFKYTPKYKSVNWWGDVQAFALDVKGNETTPGVPSWSAAARLTSALQQKGEGARNLATWDRTKQAGVAFSWSSLGAENQGLVGSEQLVRYVRGDKSNEGAGKPFRGRADQYLGDFIDAPPVFVKDLIDMSYSGLSDKVAAGGYNAYLAAKKARPTSLLVVGGNAGMLNVFNGQTGDEVLGYVPRGGLAKLAQVAAKDYGTPDNFHQFFVDGPVSETDAFVQGDWTNLLVGSMGAGGRSVFGLKVPTADPTQLTPSSVLFELADDPDLGHVMANAFVGYVPGAGWFAFFGNGVYSPNGQAVLMAMNLDTRTLTKLSVPGAAGNGLMGVRLLRNSAREVYALYAGDLQGNVWRFDLLAGGTAHWRIGLGGLPLFKTDGVGQPVVTAPITVPHPDGGRVVLFGTGRLIDLVDASSSTLQTFYGVWDKTSDGAVSSNSNPFQAQYDSGSSLRSLLQQQTLTVPPVNGFYGVSNHAVDWGQQWGWYLDLTIQAGQRVVYPPQTAVDYVYFGSIVPGGEAQACETRTGKGYNFLLSGVTGGAASIPVFDTNGDGVIDDKDSAGVGASDAPADGADKLLSNTAEVVDGDGSSRTDGNTGVDSGVCKVAGTCLVSRLDSNGIAKLMCVPCQTQLKIVDRVWRQLLQPPQPK